MMNSTFVDNPNAERWNTTVGVKDLPLDSNFAWLLCSLMVFSIWIIYITFYNARLFGLIVTSIANRFMGDAYFKVGSFSFSMLSGKIMFRDLAYITVDRTFRVQDGFVIFRWWRVYVPKDVSEDLSSLDTRLTAVLNGLEVHVYNRSRAYARLERLFGLDELLLGPDEDEPDEPPPGKAAAADRFSSWRDLIPVIKADISTGRIVFGNRLVPTTLIVSVEEAKCVYSTKPSASQLDLFMHFVKMTAENFKVIMAPSRSYTGRRDDPPRYMGEGFVVLQSNSVDIYGYMDEPGWVPSAPETERLANGDPCQSPPPVCGIEVKCGRGTDFSYGPWADRQRDSLFRFFFPPSYEPQEVTRPPRPGDRRAYQALDVRVSTLADATMDVLFTKNQETSAIHMNLGPGSYMEITIPWEVSETGCHNRVIGQLLHLDATTSLTYRNLLECESLEFSVSMHYPIYWNQPSDWTFSLTFCKATAYFVYAHKYFLNDLLDDWGSSQPPDLLHFVPSTWYFQLHFKQFELITLTNAGNWIDCSSQSPENAHLAVCGHILDLAFDLPFTDFLPETVPFLFRIEAECLQLAMYLPEVRASRPVLLSLAANALVAGRDGACYTPGAAVEGGTPGSEGPDPPAQPSATSWRHLCRASAGWVDCWRVPVLSMKIGYLYHPVPPFGPSPQANIPTPDKEAILLSPLRAPKRKLSPLDAGAAVTREDFDPDSLAPDEISVDLEVGPSELFLYGSLVDNIINFKDNIFGVYEAFTDMASVRSGSPTAGNSAGSPSVDSVPVETAPGRLQAFDPRKFRPFKVVVAITMHDIRGHLMKNCAPADPPCPTLTLERIGFEMSKSYWETRLQLLLSPVVMVVQDSVPRPEPHHHLREGHMVLSGLQVRGHAMFSNRGRGVEQDTVEYGWLLEVQAGVVTGRLTAAQMYQTVTGLETFLQLLNEPESELLPPAATQLCHHNVDQELCEHTSPEARCPSCDDIKYKMFRFSLDELDLHMVECGTSLNLQISPCRVSTCNLYGEHIKQGLTVLVPTIELYNFVSANMPFGGASDAPAMWVEAGAVRVGPIIVDLALSCDDRRGNLQAVQDRFLRYHDERKRRLWFLWDDGAEPAGAAARCGCVGGCEFFGRNTNGPRFFHPAKADETDGVNRAEYRVSDVDGDLGYGQSLLHEGRLVFDLPPATPPPPDWPWQAETTPAPAAPPADDPPPPREPADLIPPAGVDEVDAAARYGSDTGLARPAPARGVQPTLSLQTLPSAAAAATALSAGGRRGSHHSLASVGALAAPPAARLRTMASLGSEQSEFSELYFSADDDGFSSPLPTFQTPPSTLQRGPSGGGGGAGASPTEPDLPAAAARPDTTRQVSFDALLSSSSTGSNISSGSFLSAASMASGEEALLPDLNTVDLVAQVDRPITDSPLLMASYIYHLDQVECHCWSKPTPRASAAGGVSLRPHVPRPDGQGSLFAGRLFSPAFRRVTRGFSHVRIVSASAAAGRTPADDEPQLWDTWENERGEVDGLVGSHSHRGASHTTLIVRLKEDTNLALSPIMLESATRFVQTLVPALSRMHPQTVVGRHRRSAVASVLAANQLKRDPHVRLNVRRESSLRREPVLLQQAQHQQVQAYLFVPKVNVMLLQASITEETISFSALDDVRDLTCVSLATLSVERVSLQLLQHRRTHRSLHVLARNQGTSANLKPAKKKAKDVQVTYEPSLAETVDADSEESVISVDLGRCHFQLRRLKNDSQLLKDAVITAIPADKGKVFFTYADVPATSDSDFGQPSLDLNRDSGGSYGEEKLGFNMLEVGVEQLELRTVLKRGSGSASGITGGTAGGAGGGGGGAARQTTDDEPARSPQPPSANSRTDESTGSEGRDRTTALTVDVRAVWLNCAAPPNLAVMRKTDYTRSDWNMLSTCSPSINAWLNPANRLTAATVQMTSSYTRRQLAVMACLMTSALDHPNMHATPKSKYACVTSMAQTLQEDPSCQLCSVLARYIQQTPLSELETELRARFLPDTTTLKQGVLVLSRQWKNVLWMPFLLGHKFKDPPAVPTFLHQPASRGASLDTEMPADDNEIDERTCLLDIPLAPGKAARSPPSSDPLSPMSPAAEPRPPLPHQPLRSGRHSVMFPLLSAHLESPVQALGRLNRGFSRQPTRESNQSLCSQRAGTASHSSLEPLQASQHGSLQRKATDDSCEDLYSWMARQQSNNASDRCRLPLSQIRDLAAATVDSEHQPLLSVSSDEDAEVASSQPPPPSGLQVLEAHQIFEPLLASAGVLSEVLGGETILRQLGSLVNLVAGLQSLRIDISESSSGTKPRRVKLQAQLSDEPAFSLSGGRVELDLRHVADTAVGEWIQRQPHAFVTRRQLKRHTQAVINFTVCADSVALKVNMPLLRLMNQMGSIYWNAREMQHGLRTERLRKASSRRHRGKNSSSSGSEVHDLKSPELHEDPLAAPLSAGPSGSEVSLFRFPPAVLPLRAGQEHGVERGSSRTEPGQSSLETGQSPSLERPEERPETPRCWRTVYYLLKLYAIVPETKTVRNSCRLATIHEHSPDPYRGSGKYEVLREAPVDEAETGPAEADPPQPPQQPPTPPPPPPLTARKTADQRLSSRELTPLIVFGVAKVRRTQVEASLSGLRLEAEVREVQASLSGRHYSRAGRRGHQTSLTGHLGGVQVALQEQLPRTSQTVVSMTVGKSQCLYSTEAQKRGLRERNSALVTVGNVTIDIPQHPVALHGMVTRSSAHLSNTLKELRHSRSGRLVRASTFTIEDLDTPPSQPGRHRDRTARETSGEPAPAERLIHPLAVHFSVVLQSLSITAALLPSLQAQYKMDTVTSMGVTGSKAKFTIDLARHDLSFRTKVEEQNLPSSASVALPQVHISADYIQEEAEPTPVPDGVEVCQGSYFSTEAEIGALEHTLSTDLLNHLVFVQKVFMMEVNDVVQKMAGLDKFKSSILGDDDAPERPPAPAKRPVLYSLRLIFRGIQITATTPTNYAVRLETGLTELQLSNRYQRVGADLSRVVPISRLYGRAELRLNVSLGQLIRNVVFEEADAEFHQYAYFKTKIGLSNTFHDGGPAAAAEGDKEVVLIVLRRPLVYVQPMAVDKAILVWLNYRNAYDYWSEQRRTLNKEVLTATQQVLDKVPHISNINVNQLRSTLFLQVTLDDLGICLPISTNSLTGPGQMVTDAGSRDALVITLEETAVSAMTCDSLICSGRFTGFCLRFAQDFETSLDDWKPEGLYQQSQSDTMDPAIMNLCVVSEGTYEVCSHTVGINLAAENAKWILNVAWQMEGVDINVDINIGRHLSALANTLTTFTDVDEEEEEDKIDMSEIDGPSSSQQPPPSRRRTVSSTEQLCADLLTDASDPRKRAKLLENRMNEQAKVVHDLMLHGASSKILEEETRKLEAFESVVFKDFRRDMMKRLRRQSVRAGTLGNKLSLGSAPPVGRSRSVHGRRSGRPFSSVADGGVEATSSEESVLLEREEPLSPPARVTFSDTQVLRSRHASIDEGDEPEQPTPWGRRHQGPTGSPTSSGRPSPVVEVTSPPVEESEVDGVELRRPPPSPSSPSSPPSAPKQQPVEPNIHFELDVKVFVSSGRCALHTRDPAQLRPETDDIGRDSRRRGRQLSGFSDESTPSASRRRGGMLHSSSQTRLKKGAPSLSASIADLTMFHIPGLDVKLHYDSKMVGEAAPLLRPPSFGHISPEPGGGGAGGPGAAAGRRQPLAKRASLFVWMTLQSIPTETVVSPHILDFLDQLFELLPMTRGLNAIPPSPEALDAADPLTGQPGSYAGSFPVDVIVFFHMQPSTFRFSCLPVSKVECLLRLPSLDLVFSSKRADLELTEPAAGRRRGARWARESGDAPAGGLSATGVLADFSLYVFHPYGNKYTGKDHATSPLNDTDRKDSLSVKVEFVQFIVSRSRKLDLDGSGTDPKKAIVRFSTVIDLGSASFKYDMRRLTEILAFPKAWYRRTIVRRMFLGDLGDTTIPAEVERPGSPGRQSAGGGSGGPTPARSPSGTEARPRPSKLHVLQRRLSLDPVPPAGAGSAAINVPSSWETLVLFAVNFTKLNVHMNMGNVMGNVTWQTNGFTSEGRLSIGSTGHKNMFISVGLGGSSLEAKGGIVGGNVEVGKIDTYLRILEDPGVEPSHTVGLKLQTLELRLDYMGTSVLMGRVSALEATLRDEWRITAQMADNEAEGTKRPATIFIHTEVSWDQMQLMISKSTTTDLIKMYSKLEEFFLQQFQSSRRVLIGLNERPSSAKSSSLRGRTVKHRRLTEVLQETAQQQSDTRHHRHWHDALRMVAALKLKTFVTPLPPSGTVLGGTIEMRGQTISLACFHGLNFKSKSWALFSLREPSISFSTESQEIETGVPPDVHVVETLSISLGLLSHQPTARHVSMATVCRVTRTILFPPQFRSMQEWFHYTFSTSELDEVDRFPSLERPHSESGGSGERRQSRAGQASPPPQAPRLHDHNHTAEIVFALPPMQMHLKTEHTQTGAEPDMSGPKPVVVCSFVTEFEDHIFVTTDAENFFFLHDLIDTYISRLPDGAGRARASDKATSQKHSEPAVSATAAAGPEPAARPATSPSSPDGEHKVNDPTQMLQQDWREFECRTWHLEPTVRLLSWAGRRIEPYGVDFILNKLGFRHARSTIPKWLQRGSMDPLDKVLAVLVEKTVQVTREGH